MWLYKHKYNADRSLSRYKARLVANGHSQQQGIDCDETFSPVVKPATIRTVLSLAVSRQWPIHQLDMKYAIEILERAQMLNCNPCRTLVDTENKLGPEGSPVTDPTLYRSFAGALQYLTFTRPDLSYAVQQLCLYMHDPREPHLNAMKRCPATRRSTSGYCVFLGDNILTWSSKHQDTLFCSSAEVGYRGVANVVAETSWICNLLREIHTPLFTATLVYCDNVSAVYMSANPVQHQRTKHIEIDIHFVCDKVAAGHVQVLHCCTRLRVATEAKHELMQCLLSLVQECKASLSHHAQAVGKVPVEFSGTILAGRDGSGRENARPGIVVTPSDDILRKCIFEVQSVLQVLIDALNVSLSFEYDSCGLDGYGTKDSFTTCVLDVEQQVYMELCHNEIY
ncbi:ribonuclease H-like domain-containing protein [Tanacetum coccineum]|uniref:Ribonuclease H-like domain-containing protein n=1 Tax=Tanacetum coccineum TaxID=301880 RepID=A0ABQ5B751_9ASTR